MEAGAGLTHALIRQNHCGTGPVNDTARQLFLSVPFGYGTNWYRLVPWSSQYPCTGGLNQMFFGVPVIAS
jgi:hypothetical protein